MVATALRQEKQAFVDMSSLAPEGNWARAFSVMISCASKVGARMPFLGTSSRAHTSQFFPAHILCFTLFVLPFPQNMHFTLCTKSL